jgi:hypothetical protein
VEPPVGKPSTEIDGVVEMDNYDPIVAARVLSQNVSTKSDTTPPSDDDVVDAAAPDAASAGPSVPAPALEEVVDVPSAGKKRKSESKDERKAKRAAAE